MLDAFYRAPPARIGDNGLSSTHAALRRGLCSLQPLQVRRDVFACKARRNASPAKKPVVGTVFAYRGILGARPHAEARDSQSKRALLRRFRFDTVFHNVDHIPDRVEDILG